MAAGIWPFGGDAEDCLGARCHYLYAAISACETFEQWLQALGMVFWRTAAISAFEHDQYWQLAFGLLAVMRKSVLAPGVMTYCGLQCL